MAGYFCGVGTAFVAGTVAALVWGTCAGVPEGTVAGVTARTFTGSVVPGATVGIVGAAPEMASVAEAGAGATEAGGCLAGCGWMKADVLQKLGGEPLGTARRTQPRTTLEQTPSVPTSMSSSPL